jgi:hypothetical protein
MKTKIEPLSEGISRANSVKFTLHNFYTSFCRFTTHPNIIRFSSKEFVIRRRPYSNGLILPASPRHFIRYSNFTPSPMPCTYHSLRNLNEDGPATKTELAFPRQALSLCDISVLLPLGSDNIRKSTNNPCHIYIYAL